MLPSLRGTTEASKTGQLALLKERLIKVDGFSFFFWLRLNCGFRVHQRKVSLEPLPVWVGAPIQPFINVQYGYYGHDEKLFIPPNIISYFS
ncbi:hypothetical protein DTO166G4_3589 [Paecilomyces variotii]|nr:hypothetical protein DTO166G4_3589 [Paecilomyces variotii]KAJ9237425.1 hypothetical protein DTO166G5_3515 [Paecilomyces variotii]